MKGGREGSQGRVKHTVIKAIPFLSHMDALTSLRF